MKLVRRLAPAVAAAGALLAALPSTVLGHQITERYQAPLPLVVYIGGAVLAVAMSFAFVMLRNPPPPSDRDDGPVKTVPAWLRGLLGAVGLVAWLWIVAQTLFGGVGEGDVASLFLWVYGWVGLALVSAFIGPVWSWLDPFSTIHRLLTWLADRVGMTGAEPAEYPERLGRWPAVITFVAIVWVELVARVDGGHTLGMLMIAYTLITLAGMAYFGRETWRSNGEVFSVWFRLLGRLAPYAAAGEPEDGKVRRRSFGSGLLSGSWSTDQLVIIALATGAIILDGLTQTALYYDLFSGINIFGLPILRDTLIGALFLGSLVAIVLFIARRLGVAALGAGLLPVAVGYLVAHYLTYLLVDGQRIIAAFNDPLLRGNNLLPFDLGFYQPQPFLPAAVVWSIQLAAVVGGHVVGAWAGHAALVEEGLRVAPRRQLPLAALMVALTSLTLWSLGQAALSPTVQPQPAASASVASDGD